MNKVSCKHMGVGDVRRHIQGQAHIKASKGIEMQSRLAFTSSKDDLTKKVSIMAMYSLFTI